MLGIALAILSAVTLVSLPDPATPAGAASPAGASGVHPGARDYYVDCAHGSDAASGTSSGHAWRTLAKADAVTLVSGDSVLFKRSVRCDGVFDPRGSGTQQLPITAGAYGTGSLPILDGQGARATVVLDDVQGWVVRDLAITDAGPSNQPGVVRSGIEVDNDRLGTAHGFTIEDDDISRVDTSSQVPPGESTENFTKAGGGIEFTSTKANGFDAVLIAHNRLSGVTREGIFVSGALPTTDLVIGWNSLQNIGGDGIVAVHSVGALVTHNTVSRFNLVGTSSNAGIWAYDSSRDVFQFNCVSHGENGPLDGMAYDIDGGDQGLVFQYNLSYDNTGGFLMLCNNPGSPRSPNGSIVRYNISQNDSAVGVRGVIDAPSVCGGEQDVSIYNNTVYTRAPRLVTMEDNGNGSAADFANNIIVGPGVQATITDPLSTWQNNLYLNVSCVQRRADSGAVVAQPAFVGPGAATSIATAGGYKLRTGSPAIRAGTVIADNGGRDFFGNPVPVGAAPNIGAYQGRGVTAKGRTATGPAVAPGCGAH